MDSSGPNGRRGDKRPRAHPTHQVLDVDIGRGQNGGSPANQPMDELIMGLPSGVVKWRVPVLVRATDSHRKMPIWGAMHSRDKG